MSGLAPAVQSQLAANAARQAATRRQRQGDPATLAGAARQRGIAFGTAIGLEEYGADPAYAALARREADIYAPRNELKPGRIWSAGPDKRDFTRCDQWMATAAADGKSVRGHTLFWRPNQPKWQDETTVTAPNCRDLADAHMAAVLGRYPDMISVDVCNEEFSGTTDVDAQGYKTNIPLAWIKAFGSGDAYFQYLFQAAEQAAPNMPLAYCDNATEQTDDSWHNRHRAYIVGAIRRAKDAGRRIDIFSMQMHLDLRYDWRTDAKPFAKFCNDLAATDIEINVTEQDVRASQGWTGTAAEFDAAAADLVRSRYDILLSSKAKVGHISCWGLVDSYADYKAPSRPLPFDAAMQPKPMHGAMVTAFGTNVP